MAEKMPARKTGVGGLEFTTMDLLIAAVTAAVGGVINIYIVLPYAKAIEGLLGPWGIPLNTIFFLLWGLIASLITGKPLIGIGTHLMDGIIQLILGSAQGSVLLVFVFLEGLGLEIGRAITFYRYSLTSAAVAGALGCVGTTITMFYVFGFVELTFALQLGFFALEIVIGALGGMLAYAIVKGIENTGVLSRARREVTYIEEE